MPERSKGPEGYSSLCLTFLDHSHVLVPLAAAVTTKHCENIAVIY